MIQYLVKSEGSKYAYFATSDFDVMVPRNIINKLRQSAMFEHDRAQLDRYLLPHSVKVFPFSGSKIQRNRWKEKMGIFRGKSLGFLSGKKDSGYWSDWQSIPPDRRIADFVKKGINHQARWHHITEKYAAYKIEDAFDPVAFWNEWVKYRVSLFGNRVHMLADVVYGTLSQCNEQSLYCDLSFNATSAGMLWPSINLSHQMTKSNRDYALCYFNCRLLNNASQPFSLLYGIANELSVTEYHTRFYYNLVCTD